MVCLAFIRGIRRCLWNSSLLGIRYLYDQNALLVEREPIDNFSIAEVKGSAVVLRLVIQRVDHQNLFRRQRRLPRVRVHFLTVPLLYGKVNIYRPNQQAVCFELLQTIPQVSAQGKHDFMIMEGEFPRFIPSL